MKRFISVLAICLCAMLFCVQTASAAMIGDTSLIRADLDSVLDDPLRERLEQAEDDDVIRVTVELADDIDLDRVELNAISRANISSAEEASLNAAALSSDKAESESVQLAALKVYDKISKERNDLLKEYFGAKNGAFISSTCLRNAEIGSVGLFTPFIRKISLTKSEILKLAADPKVYRIYLYEELYLDDLSSYDSSQVYQDINDTYKLVGGDAFINAGYTGSGIRVGVVERYRPELDRMGSDSNNITIVPGSADTTYYHPTMVCGIIKKFAPSCSIFSYAVGNSTDGILDVCENLIDNHSLNVINLSIGKCSGLYTEHARKLDLIVRNTRVTFVVAAGNANVTTKPGDDGEPEDEIDSNINILGMACNAITVGNAKTVGTNPDAPGAFTLSWNSCYEEDTKKLNGTSTINKPDICAPGYIRIYGYEDYGTSHSAPHVTGTVVQMMARNPAFVSQPQKIKAAILASATRNCGTDFFGNTRMSDYEGAGVLDAEFCYRLAKAGRAACFEVTSDFTPVSDSIVQQVYCDYTTKPFRIACTWEAAAADDGNALNITNYNLTVYKNGAFVANAIMGVDSSLKKTLNSKIIEIPPDVLKNYGGGYYEVHISRRGSFSGSGTVRIGLAWEQD